MATTDATTAGAKVQRDLAINFTTRHLTLVEGDLVFCTAAAAVLQDIWLALGFFEGEWFLDETVGFPYFRKVLVKNPNQDEIRALYRDKILSRLGVRDLLLLTLDFQRAARTLAVSFRVTTDVGELASSRTIVLGS